MDSIHFNNRIDWIFLIKEAKALGLSKEEILLFLKNSSQSEKVV